jgi:hypothetical protein
MKNIFKILCCFFIFIQNNYAQEQDKTAVIQPSLNAKISVLALAEYATCLHISPEFRFSKRFSIQPEIGFYTDILRNSKYNASTNAMSGIRFGGEVRYYFKNWNPDRPNWYIGLSYINNLSKIAKMQDALVLRNGAIEKIQTPIRFNHERTFIDGVFGTQFCIKKRVLMNVFTGLGFTKRSISNLEQVEPRVLFANCSPPVQLLFPSSNVFTGPSVFDTYDILDIAFGLKIGYIIF